LSLALKKLVKTLIAFVIVSSVLSIEGLSLSNTAILKALKAFFIKSILALVVANFF
jgi:hypothetical protein